MKLSRVGLAGTLAALLLAAPGCGSDESGDESQLLPRQLGADLAAQSDSVQRTLALGKGCAARRQARQLREDVERAIEEDRVPLELQGELRRRANGLADSIVCDPAPPPPPPTRTDDDGEGEDD